MLSIVSKDASLLPCGPAFRKRVDPQVLLSSVNGYCCASDATDLHPFFVQPPCVLQCWAKDLDVDPSSSADPSVQSTDSPMKHCFIGESVECMWRTLRFLYYAFVLQFTQLA